MSHFILASQVGISQKSYCFENHANLDNFKKKFIDSNDNIRFDFEINNFTEILKVDKKNMYVYIYEKIFFKCLRKSFF